MSAFENAVGAGLGDCAVSPGMALLMGISGGPDSTALLCALSALSGPMELKLSACIVDHGIRPRAETEQDIELVRAACGARGISLEIAVVPAGRCRDRARLEGRSLEEVAREARLRLLLAAARRAGASAVALGHTQDDAVETLLMRVIQGSDVGGLAGIAPVRGSFIHPMLRCTRREVIGYLQSLSQPWREDATNQDTTILRNRVRRHLVPVLESHFPGYRSGLLALSTKAALASELVRGQADRMDWAAAPRGFSILRSVFQKAPPAVRAASLLGLYDRIRRPGWPRRLPWRFLLPALAPGLPVRSGTILRGHGVQLAARGNRLLWERCIVSRGKKGYFIEVSDARSSRIPEIGVRVNLARASEKGNTEADELVLLSREIVPPLCLRSRRAGDEILLESGTTSLKELFAGWKVSERDRQVVPLLADRKGVVAVLGAALGYHNRVRAGARALPNGEAERIVVRASRNMEEGREQ